MRRNSQKISEFSESAAAAPSSEKLYENRRINQPSLVLMLRRNTQVPRFNVKHQYERSVNKPFFTYFIGSTLLELVTISHQFTVIFGIMFIVYQKYSVETN